MNTVGLVALIAGVFFLILYVMRRRNRLNREDVD
jgi:hypothetical protein